MKPLLSVKNLYVRYSDRYAVEGISFDLMCKEILGVVGASGSGKSSIARALMRFLPKGSFQGEIFYNGIALHAIEEGSMRLMRGREIAIIFQDPMTSLNPILTIGAQICESDRQRKQEMLHLLERVGFSNPERIARAYPHMLSGGMRQRAMIALALFNHPKILIADEPTTALDATTQMHILELLQSLQKEMAMSVILITHDLSVVEGMCDRTLVMEKGRIVEEAKTCVLFSTPAHEATRGLLAALPRFDMSKKRSCDRGSVSSLISVYNLSKHFKVGNETVSAVCDVSLHIPSGKTLGLIGESGCGKSTFGRMLLRLDKPSSGDIFFDSINMTALSARAFRLMRPHIQGVFQNPYAALSPRMRIRDILYEPFIVYPDSCVDKEERIQDLLENVGLSSDVLDRYPHEFSGGQRQRIAIARALMLNPKFLVCDEPFSALDAVIQEQIVMLLQSLQRKWALTYLVIAHNLAIVKYISDFIAVMYLGCVVEQAPADALYAQPLHPYTQALFDAALFSGSGMERSKIVLKGDVPLFARHAKGCPFVARCPYAQKVCMDIRPELKEVSPQHYVACHIRS